MIRFFSNNIYFYVLLWRIGFPIWICGVWDRSYYSIRNKTYGSSHRFFLRRRKMQRKLRGEFVMKKKSGILRPMILLRILPVEVSLIRGRDTGIQWNYFIIIICSVRRGIIMRWLRRGLRWWWDREWGTLYEKKIYESECPA